MSKKEKKTEQIQTQGASQSSTPSWIQNSHQQYMDGVNGLMGQGASAFTPAGPNALQQQAFSGAANLGTAPQYDWASKLGLAAGTAGANTSTAQGYNAAQVDPNQFGVGQTTVGPMSQASSRNITDLNLNDYLNAGLGDQITAARADYDADAGRVRAAQSGQAAVNGGARNSNNAVQSAITEEALYRAANTGLANIRANAYDQAGNLATNDLNREASTNQFNSGQTNQGLLAQAGIDANRASQTSSQGFQGALSNQNANNAASQFNAGAQNQNSQFNAGQQDNALTRMLQSAGLLSSVGQAKSADDRANLGMQSDMGNQQYQMELMQQQYPLQYQQIMQSLSGFNPALYGGSTNNQLTNSNSTSSTSDPLGSLGALMQGAGSLFAPIKIPGFNK